MQDIELSSMGQGYPSLLTTRRPLTKAVGIGSRSFVVFSYCPGLERETGALRVRWGGHGRLTGFLSF